MRAAGGLRISLRQLLLLVVVFAIGCLALKYANSAWQAVFSAVVLLSFMIGAIVALIGRGAEQCFAIGFVTCVLIYVTVVHASDNSEFDPYSGKLLTSKAMKPIYQQLSTQVTIDFSTGRPVPTGNLPAVPSGTVVAPGQPLYAPPMLGSGPTQPLVATPLPVPNAGGGISGGAPWPSMIGTAQIPDRYAFMAIAHSLWALLLGCAGGMFGRAIYARRTELSKDD